MRKYLRTRNYFLVGGSVLVLLLNYLTDPNGGALTFVWLLQLATPIAAVWFSYLARLALFDYLDMEELLNKAKQSSTGAGLAFAGVCIIIFALLGLFGTSARAQDVTTYIPTKAYAIIPILEQEQIRLWSDHPKGI